MKWEVEAKHKDFEVLSNKLTNSTTAELNKDHEKN